MSNRYAALETENKMSGNVTNLKTVSVNKSKTINNMQLGIRYTLNKTI